MVPAGLISHSPQSSCIPRCSWTGTHARACACAAPSAAPRNLRGGRRASAASDAAPSRPPERPTWSLILTLGLLSLAWFGSSLFDSAAAGKITVVLYFCTSMRNPSARRREFPRVPWSKITKDRRLRRAEEFPGVFYTAVRSKNPPAEHCRGRKVDGGSYSGIGSR